MKFETSKTLSEIKYSNGSISLFDLMFENPVIECSNEKDYQDIVEILLYGTWANDSAINGIEIKKIIRDYQDDLIIRKDNLYSQSEFETNNSNLFYEEFSYLSPLFRRLNSYRDIYLNKSLNPANVENSYKFMELFIEPSLFYSANSITLEEALIDDKLLEKSYQRIVLRNLIDYAEKNKFKAWKTESLDIPHENVFFISIKRTEDYKVLIALPLLDIEELDLYKVKMSNYLSQNNKRTKNYTGLIIVPFGEYESMGDLAIVPLSCLKE